MTVTFFKTLFDKNPKYYDADKILESFRNGPKDQVTASLLDQIRSTKDKEQRNELKKQLPVILFGGEFKERLDTALKSYSKLVVLDFDNCDVIKKRTELSLLDYVYAVWVSPSGDGLKALIKVSSDNHDGHF